MNIVKNLYPKFDSLDKMGQFHERQNLPKFIQREIYNLNKTLFIREIESIISNLSKLKALGPDGYTGKFYWTLTEDITVYCDFFQKIKVEGILFNSFYKNSTILKPKPQKTL